MRKLRLQLLNCTVCAGVPVNYTNAALDRGLYDYNITVDHVMSVPSVLEALTRVFSTSRKYRYDVNQL